MDDGGRTRGAGSAARWRVAAWTAAALLLLAPAVAMRFTDEVNWTALDFAVFGALLLAALGAFELGLRRARDTSGRVVVAVVVGAAFLLAWAQGAVGVFGAGRGLAGPAFAGVVATVIVVAVAWGRRRRP
jgi:peptidoglycan/LPS O-acetylase OafA/YrhL